jgi:hypothetical protein
MREDCRGHAAISLFIVLLPVAATAQVRFTHYQRLDAEESSTQGRYGSVPDSSLS